MPAGLRRAAATAASEQLREAGAAPPRGRSPMRSHPSESGGAWAEGGKGMLPKPGDVRWGLGGGKGATEGFGSVIGTGEGHPWEGGRKEHGEVWVGDPPSAAFLEEVLRGLPGPSHLVAAARREEFSVGWLLRSSIPRPTLQSPQALRTQNFWLEVRIAMRTVAGL